MEDAEAEQTDPDDGERPDAKTEHSRHGPVDLPPSKGQRRLIHSSY